MDQNINNQMNQPANANNKDNNEIVFESTAAAQAVRDEADKVLKRAWIGFIIAAAVSAFWLLFNVAPPQILKDSDTVMAIALVLALVGTIASYILAGGFKTAISVAFKIAKFGWIILPFPVDIVTGIICFFIAVIIFIAFPIIFVAYGYLQKKKEHKAAMQYLMLYEASAANNNNIQ